MKMIFLMSFLLVGFAVANPPDPVHQINCEDNTKWRLYHKQWLWYGILLKSEENPNHLEICVKGNGFEDEVHLDVNSEDDKTGLVFRKYELKSVLVIMKFYFAVVFRHNEPGILRILKNGECTKRIYDESNPKHKLKVEVMNREECDDLIKELQFPLDKVRVLEANRPSPQSVISCEDSTTWELFEAGILQYGIKKKEKQGILEICLVGNGVEDMVHVNVISEEDKKGLVLLTNSEVAILMLKKYNFAVVSKKSEPGSLIVIENGECYWGTYDKSNRKKKLDVKQIDHQTCDTLKRSLKMPVNAIANHGNGEAQTMPDKEIAKHGNGEEQKMPDKETAKHGDWEDKKLPVKEIAKDRNWEDHFTDSREEYGNVRSVEYFPDVDLGPFCDPVHWILHNTDFITYGFRKNLQNMEKQDTFEICVMRNGVEDVLHVKLRSEEDKKNIKIKIYPDKIIFSLPTGGFAALCERSAPGTMLVVENNKCTMRWYERIKLSGREATHEEMNDEFCKSAQNDINELLSKNDNEETESAAKGNQENKVGSAEFPEAELSNKIEKDILPPKWVLKNTGEFTFGLVREPMKKPDLLEIFVAGNGIEDVLIEKVHSEEDKNGLVINIYPTGIIFNLPTYNFAAISDTTEPSTMIVINNGVCKRRRYDKTNPRQKLPEEEVGQAECGEVKNKIKTLLAQIKETIEKQKPGVKANKETTPMNQGIKGNMAAPGQTDILYYKERNDKLQKWPLQHQGEFEYGIVLLEHKERKYTLGMYLKGNGVEDELHAELNAVQEMKELHIQYHNGRITFNLPSHRYAAVSKETERGSLIVVKNGVCRRMIYDESNPRHKLKEEVVELNTCNGIMSELGIIENRLGFNTKNKNVEVANVPKVTQRKKRNWISSLFMKIWNFLTFKKTKK